MKSSVPMEDQRVEDYFSAYQLTPLLEKQKTYIQTVEKSIKHWKYIEIISEDEIEEIFEFYFPSYEYQYIYINNSKSDPYMIESIKNNKAYLYRAERLNGNFIKWNQIKQLEDFDSEFQCPVPNFLPFYSPDFSYHIDLNRKEKKFRIRDTISN